MINVDFIPLVYAVAPLLVYGGLRSIWQALLETRFSLLANLNMFLKLILCSHEICYYILILSTLMQVLVFVQSRKEFQTYAKVEINHSDQSPLTQARLETSGAYRIFVYEGKSGN